MIRMIMAPILILALTGTLAAQDVVREGRYAMVPFEDGIIRLDTATGVVSRCTGERHRLACRALPDERLAYEDEISRLEDRIAALESRVAGLENRRSLNGLNVPDSSEAFPDEEEIDKMMTLAEQVMRRFFGLVKELKRDLETDQL